MGSLIGVVLPALVPGSRSQFRAVPMDLRPDATCSLTVDSRWRRAAEAPRSGTRVEPPHRVRGDARTNGLKMTTSTPPDISAQFLLILCRTWIDTPASRRVFGVWEVGGPPVVSTLPRIAVVGGQEPAFSA